MMTGDELLNTAVLGSAGRGLEDFVPNAKRLAKQAKLTSQGR